MDGASILQTDPAAVQTIWWLTIIVALVVTGVVAVLLTMVKRVASNILDGASAIWTHGKLVANDTIQIPIFLKETNHIAGRILETATQIVGATDTIQQHADGCPGCPACVLSPIEENP